MKNYALYYSYKGIGDVLMVVFDNSLSATKIEKKDKVVAIYHDEEIIGYNIFDIKEIVKIKSEGLIYYPGEEFLNIVNSVLSNASLPTLDSKENSGYFIGEVTDVVPLSEEKSFISLTTGEEYCSAIIKNGYIAVNDRVVFAKVGTFLNNGSVVKEGHMDGTLLDAHICTNYELGIKDDEEKILVLDEDAKVGEDFFKVEENL